jgi:hypothetical protein
MSTSGHPPAWCVRHTQAHTAREVLLMRWFMVAALVCAAGCSGSGTPAVPPTVTVAPSAAVDANARAACDQLARARILRAGGESEKPVDGYGASTSEMQATGAELKALDLALKSTVPQVRQTGLDADAPALTSWCQDHHL